MRCGTRILTCFWLSCVVFIASACKTVGITITVCNRKNCTFFHFEFDLPKSQPCCFGHDQWKAEKDRLMTWCAFSAPHASLVYGITVSPALFVTLQTWRKMAAHDCFHRFYKITPHISELDRNKSTQKLSRRSYGLKLERESEAIIVMDGYMLLSKTIKSPTVKTTTTKIVWVKTKLKSSTQGR